MGINYIIISKGLITFIDIMLMFLSMNEFSRKRGINEFVRWTFICILFILTLLVIINIKNLVLKFAVSVVIVNIMMNLIFSNSKIKIFFKVITVFLLLLITEYIVYVIIKSDTTMYALLNNNDYNTFPLAVLTRFIVFLIVVISVTRYRFNLDLNLSQMLKFMLIGVFTAFGIINSVIPVNSSIIYSNYITTFIYIFNIILMYCVLSDFIKMSNKIRLKDLNEERIKGELNLYKELERKSINQKKILHDYRNILMCIKSLVHKNEYEYLTNYVDNLSTDIMMAEDYVCTGNTLVDVLINSKYEKALSQDVTLVLKLDYLANLKIKDEEMIVILSNLLDNALEHCLTLKSKEKLVILNIKQQKKLKIAIRNPIESEVVVKDKIVKTSKTGDNHGIGLSNIKDIVNKYDGNIYIDTDDGNFDYLIEL